MRYLLAVLSHGNPSPTAERCLDSFAEHVTPRPSAAVSYHDGPGMGYAPVELVQETGHWQGTAGGEQHGFCAATAALWELAAGVATEAECDYVFWLEHDFVFPRPIDLNGLAYVLTVRHDLAQMALLRQPVNEREKAAGGLVASRPGEFQPRVTYRDLDGASFDWLRQDSYFTTNPSLMRTRFMLEHPFTHAQPECEGRYGASLREQGFMFGAWGDGDPWVEHIGIRNGKGY